MLHFKNNVVKCLKFTLTQLFLHITGDKGSSNVPTLDRKFIEGKNQKKRDTPLTVLER